MLSHDNNKVYDHKLRFDCELFKYQRSPPIQFGIGGNETQRLEFPHFQIAFYVELLDFRYNSTKRLSFANTYTFGRSKLIT